MWGLVVAAEGPLQAGRHSRQPETAGVRQGDAPAAQLPLLLSCPCPCPCLAPRARGLTEAIRHAPKAAGTLVDAEAHQPRAQRREAQRGWALRVGQQLPELHAVAEALLALGVARLAGPGKGAARC
jgi:hypothetical protein